jgi:hypothetical protein
LLASGGVTHFVLMPLHFVTARRLNCYVCGPTRQVILVFVLHKQGEWFWYLSPCKEATHAAIESPGC